MSPRILRVVSSIAFALAATPAIAQQPDQPPPPADQPPPPPPPPDQPPPRQPPPPPPDQPPPHMIVQEPPPQQHLGSEDKSPTWVKGKTSLTLYGFVQLYGIYDTTQGLAEQAQNTALARPNTYTGDHGQTMISARHSRFGVKIDQEVYDGIKVKGLIEGDFLGNQPTGAPVPGTTTEIAFFQNAAFRVRHAAAFVESSVIDVIAGQYWPLFGWQSYFHPNTLEIQGILGQVYKRTAQLRFGKTFKSDAVTFDIAVAALRPPERASATPDGQAGMKLTFNKLKGWRTKGFNDSTADAAAIGVSVIGRKFAVDEFKTAPVNQVVKNGYGVSIDAYLPIVPASKENHGNALSLTGSFVTGAGITDQYDGLTFGVANPPCTGTCNNGAAAPGVYTPNVDNGLVMWFPNPDKPDANGLTTFSLHPIHSLSYMVGVQYYLPPRGRVWLAGNFSHVESDNAHLYGLNANPAGRNVWSSGNYVDGVLFVDATPNLRLGASFSVINQTFVSPLCGPAGMGACVGDISTNVSATNYRTMGSVILLF